MNQTLKNYEGLGLDGTMNLWYRKLITTWSDGGFFYWSPSTSEGNNLSEYVRGSGARNQLTKVYSQAFRLMMIICFLMACAFAAMRQKVPGIVLIMMITIFGCVAFHSVWETNARYSIPFILPMLTVIVYGIESAQEYIDKKELIDKSHKHISGIAMMGFLLIVCSSLNTALKEETTLSFYRIISTINTRVCDDIKPNDFICLDQDFYSEKPFNTLTIKAAIPAQMSREDCSNYNLSIMNGDRQVLYSTQITPDLISGQGLTVSFDTISGYNHYYVRLQKEQSEKESIQFYTHNTYAINEYRGVLSVDGSIPYSNDLMMDVCERKKTTVFSDKARILIIAFIMFLGGFIFFIPTRAKKGYYKVSSTKIISNRRAEKY